MGVKEIWLSKDLALELTQFREMDYFAVEEYNLPIELMMENAGLHLANLVAMSTAEKNAKILIGVGNGNNGGGGLVAARRLAAWGYDVYIETFTRIDRELPKRQLERALNFGAKKKSLLHPDVWIDSYLGFSQRLPLSDSLAGIVEKANNCECLRISLDIPTGFLGDIGLIYFKADKVLSLAAPKKILYSLPEGVELYVADLGLPKEVYEKFNTVIPPFSENNILKIKRSK
jgi:NAD(P)H-hydrate epimerase